jgi:hypothetical protein
MGSGGSDSPKESYATQQLTAQQTGMLKDIQSTVQQLDPYTFSLLGFKTEETPGTTTTVKGSGVSTPTPIIDPEPVYGYRPYSRPGGMTYSGDVTTTTPGTKKLVAMTEAEKYAQLSGMDKNLYDLGMLQYGRLNDAYAGKVGISPALEADLAKQQAVLEQTLAQKLGPNWATSTPGIQAINEFQKQAGLVREEARLSMLSEGQGLLLQNLGYQQGAKQQQLSNLVNIPSARYQANLSSGQELLNSSIAKDNYYNSYKASQSGGVSKGAGAASGALMGAATGAYVGSVVPGIGTAIGAIGGGLIGGIGGLLAGN